MGFYEVVCFVLLFCFLVFFLFFFFFRIVRRGVKIWEDNSGVVCQVKYIVY